MRKILFILMFIPALGIVAQNSKEEAYKTYQKAQDIAYDAIASFCEFPNEHDNTIKVFSRLQELNNILKRVSSPAELGEAMDLFSKFKKLEFRVNAFIELLRPINGYNSAGLTNEQMEIVRTCFSAFNWKENILNIKCTNALFYEFECGNFKMLFIKNTLPPADYMHGIYNQIEVDFTYDYYGTGGTYVVGGGKYRMIQYKDTDKRDYHKVIKASSK